MTPKIVILSLLLIGSIEARHLFTKVKNPPVSTKEIPVCQSKNILSCNVVKINLGAITETSLTLPRKSTVTFINQPGENSFTFHDKKGTEAIFNRKQSKLLGNVNYWDGRDFTLEPCHNFPGCHVWIEHDVKKWVDGPTQHIRGAQFDVAPRRDISSLIQKGRDDSTTVVTYSVMVYYTPQFKIIRPDVSQYVEWVIDETNEGYNNSKLPIKIQLHCIEETTFQEDPNIYNMLAIFGKYKPLDELRKSADVAVLLVTEANSCGVAPGIGTFWNGNTISVVEDGCGLGYYTFGHEIGHNIGAHHANTVNRKYPHGQGKLIAGTRARTIMGYRTDANPQRINFWSNPDVMYEGKPTGTKREDNARVWRENRFALAAIGDESQACGTTESGVILSPNYPSNYDNNMDKTYSVQVAAGKKIRLIFNEFQLEDPDRRGYCAYDYISIENGDGTKLWHRLCGTFNFGSDARLDSKSNKVNIIFHSDRSVNGKGFKITWKAV